jgi:D-mannonate dehydratase
MKADDPYQQLQVAEEKQYSICKVNYNFSGIRDLQRTDMRRRNTNTGLLLNIQHDNS